LLVHPLILSHFIKEQQSLKIRNEEQKKEIFELKKLNEEQKKKIERLETRVVELEGK
jgi:rRNA processing protein Krr1/Pno1